MRLTEHSDHDRYIKWTSACAYAEFVCLPQRELVPVQSGLDAAEAVSVVLNYAETIDFGEGAVIRAGGGGQGRAQVAAIDN
jgi:NADPH:quinone reductase-like Zn-dependent oxidoreductase